MTAKLVPRIILAFGVLLLAACGAAPLPNAITGRTTPVNMEWQVSPAEVNVVVLAPGQPVPHYQPWDLQGANPIYEKPYSAPWDLGPADTTVKTLAPGQPVPSYLPWDVDGKSPIIAKPYSPPWEGEPVSVPQPW